MRILDRKIADIQSHWEAVRHAHYSAATIARRSWLRRCASISIFPRDELASELGRVVVGSGRRPICAGAGSSRTPQASHDKCRAKNRDQLRQRRHRPRGCRRRTDNGHHRDPESGDDDAQRGDSDDAARVWRAARDAAGIPASPSSGICPRSIIAIRRDATSELSERCRAQVNDEHPGKHADDENQRDHFFRQHWGSSSSDWED